jgi:hypothetical protein
MGTRMSDSSQSTPLASWAEGMDWTEQWTPHRSEKTLPEKRNEKNAKWRTKDG